MIFTFHAPNSNPDAWSNEVWDQMYKIQDEIDSTEVEGHTEWDSYGVDPRTGRDTNLVSCYVIDDAGDHSLEISLDTGDPWLVLHAITEEMDRIHIQDEEGNEQVAWLSVTGIKQISEHTLKLSFTWGHEEQHDIRIIVAEKCPVETLPLLLGTNEWVDRVIQERMKHGNS